MSPDGNLDRFSGFAELYDRFRPSAPSRLGPVLSAYAGVDRPDVVDLGCGTGLSSRWAADWAATVIGIEPNEDMLARARSIVRPNVGYRRGTSAATGLDDDCADVVTAVQALHWMEPVATFAEIGRLLRPGGVFAAIDADWPPVLGSWEIEAAWAVMHGRMRVLEARLARGEDIEHARRPIRGDDDALRDEDLRDPHRNRAIPGGVRSWSKSDHLARLSACGIFTWTRELVLDSEPSRVTADDVVMLMQSQGSYQGLRRAGLDDDDVGLTDFAGLVRGVLSDDASATFCWRVRLGVAESRQD